CREDTGCRETEKKATRQNHSPSPIHVNPLLGHPVFRSFEAGAALAGAALRSCVRPWFRVLHGIRRARVMVGLVEVPSPSALAKPVHALLLGIGFPLLSRPGIDSCPHAFLRVTR